MDCRGLHPQGFGYAYYCGTCEVYHAIYPQNSGVHNDSLQRHNLATEMKYEPATLGFSKGLKRG